VTDEHAAVGESSPLDVVRNGKRRVPHFAGTRCFNEGMAPRHFRVASVAHRTQVGCVDAGSYDAPVMHRMGGGAVIEGYIVVRPAMPRTGAGGAAWTGCTFRRVGLLA
jgi:hypothetical protein